MSALAIHAISAAALEHEAAAFRRPEVMEALAAAAALMAHADGEVASAERSRLLDQVRETAAFDHLSREDLIEAMATHEANYRLDPEVAIEIAYEKLGAVAGQSRLASAVVAVCRAMIPADGIAHPSEYRTLADIRQHLGLVARTVSLAGFGAPTPLAPPAAGA